MAISKNTIGFVMSILGFFKVDGMQILQWISSLPPIETMCLLAMHGIYRSDPEEVNP